MASVTQIVGQKIQGGPPRKVWTPKDFIDVGSRSAVDVALHRLASINHIRRVDRGLYDMPIQNSLTGKASPPDHNAVVAAVARRDGARVLVDGMTAANGLGLTNAVPAHVTVLTDARIQPIALGNMTIVFKPAAPSKLVWAGRPAAAIVQALGWLRDVMPADGSRIASRLRAILTDPIRGRTIRDDLAAGMGDLPSWTVPLIKDLLAATAPQPQQDDSDAPGLGMHP